MPVICLLAAHWLSTLTKRCDATHDDYACLAICVWGRVLFRVHSMSCVFPPVHSQLIQQCRAVYLNTLERLQLPVEEERLQAQHATAMEAAMALFARDRFGNAGSPGIAKLQEDLKALIERELRCAGLCHPGGLWETHHACVSIGPDLMMICPGCVCVSSYVNRHSQIHSRIIMQMPRIRQTANTHASSRVCERLEMACEDEIEAQQHVALPSLERFQARTRRCKERFDTQCVGPGRTTQQGASAVGLLGLVGVKAGL